MKKITYHPTAQIYIYKEQIVEKFKKFESKTEVISETDIILVESTNFL